MKIAIGSDHRGVDARRRLIGFLERHGHSVKDCGSYFFCWNNGLTGDKYYCSPGLIWNDSIQMCDWPYNLPEDHICYQPLP